MQNSTNRCARRAKISTKGMTILPFLIGPGKPRLPHCPPASCERIMELTELSGSCWVFDIVTASFLDSFVTKLAAFHCNWNLERKGLDDFIGFQLSSDYIFHWRLVNFRDSKGSDCFTLDFRDFPLMLSVFHCITYLRLLRVPAVSRLLGFIGWQLSALKSFGFFISDPLNRMICFYWSSSRSKDRCNILLQWCSYKFVWETSHTTGTNW